MSDKILHSERLILVASTLAHIRTELQAPDQLSALLNAQISPAWPPGEYDRDAMEFFHNRLEKGGEAVVGWYSWYAIRPADSECPSTLLGAGGYFGPSDPDGIVEIGYSVVPEWRRHGYATEMVKLLVANAFTFPNIKMVIAHTTEENEASISVLSRNGFQAAGTGEEPNTLRFEHPRPS